jgi:hypothetical protein
MQHDDVEVSFCDLCGTSVPIADLDAKTALRHQGKTIGACCLSTLRGAAAAEVGRASAPVIPAAAPAHRHASSGGDARMLPVAIVLLAAIAAATLFLDHRITAADTFHRTSLGQLSEASTSDSQVLAALALAMDAVPRRPELEALAQKVDALAASAGGVPAELDKRTAAIAKDVAALGEELRAQSARIVDPKPQLDELRQRQSLVIELLTALRATSPVPAPAEAAPRAPAAPPENAGPALPPALADQIKKLQATDPAVRFEAVDELVRSKDPLVLPHLLPLARDPDTFVRRLTVEGLADFKRPEVVEALLAALADTNDYVRDSAWRSLKQITGQKLPFEANGSKDARARAIQKWQEWWDKNKATFSS